jgi:hypothetical protein
MIQPCVDNDQIAVLCRCLPDEERVPAASGRGIEGGGGFSQKTMAVPACVSRQPVRKICPKDSKKKYCKYFL